MKIQEEVKEYSEKFQTQINWAEPIENADKVGEREQIKNEDMRDEETNHCFPSASFLLFSSK